MKISIKVFSLLVVVMLVTNGCSVIGHITGRRMITPSKVIISEPREVSGFSGIEMGTIGKVVLSQGSSESLTVEGNDNLIPLIKTTVSNGILYIGTTENFNVTSARNEIKLIFTIVVKDLGSLIVSGLGDVEMETLTTPQLTMTMSGGGRVRISRLTTTALTLTLSGMGNVELSGEAKKASIDISGTGKVNSPDLKIQTANVTVPGLGGSTLWVTDQLTGDISGAGSVSYYGTPKINVNTTGLGGFKSLGNK